MKQGRLSGKIAFITGASAGIGEATARAFADEGASLLLCARRIEKVDSLARALLEEYGVKAYSFKLDVSRVNDVDRELSRLPSEWQAIDILISNAGLARERQPFQISNRDAWIEMVDTNIKGLLAVTHAVLPGMVKRNRGHIINLGSVAGVEPYAGGTVYCATKSVARTVTLALRHDVLGTNIRVTCIEPGAVETEFSMVRFAGDERAAKKVYEGMTPLVAADIADTITFAATRPPHVNISELLIMPTDQASATSVHRK